MTPVPGATSANAKSEGTLSRRDFLVAGALATPAMLPARMLVRNASKHASSDSSDPCAKPDFRSSHLAVGFAPTRPEFNYFAVDSLGGGQLEQNPALSMRADPPFVRLEKSGNVFTYYSLFGSAGATPWWTIECHEKHFILRSHYQPMPMSRGVGLESGGAFMLSFRQQARHATLLGLMPPGEPKMSLPCVLHLPDMGSLRITGTVSEMKLAYSGKRYVDVPMVRYVNVMFPAATAEHPVVEYRLEVAAIYPELDGIEKDPRFDGFRRNFLNAFQIVARWQMLGTNTSSDICPFTLFMFAEMAVPHLQLAEGLTTADLVRMTADRYLSGVKGYGQPGYTDHYYFGPLVFSDVDPSLILGSALYVSSTGDFAWARKWHEKIMAICREMMATDTSGDGLIKFGRTGNYNDRPHSSHERPANWWDTINFGYEDAYSNALAYRALVTWADVAQQLSATDEAAWLRRTADKLKSAYLEKFLNPATGVLGGWRSADGQLHDYWFVFLNSVAIAYGVVDGPVAQDIMTRLLNKLTEIGFTDFKVGLPGNLIPVRRGDCVDFDLPNSDGRVHGVPNREDGTDIFPFYENGGASQRYTMFTLKALYRLGRLEDARKMLYPMLEGYKAGIYQGFDANGYANDWWDWKHNRACGYEGFAVGNDLPLLAVLDEWKTR